MLALQQRGIMLRRLAVHARHVGADADADQHESKADEASRHADQLSRLVGKR